MDYNMEELLPIVSELAQKYAGSESTSITYEKAQTLMEAVLYCLDEYSRSCANSLVDNNVSVKEQYHIGANLILEKVNGIKEFLMLFPVSLMILELSVCMIQCKKAYRNS